MTAFLTSMAVKDHVAASTQNQALSGVLFLYREVLRQDPGVITDVPRARTPHHVPVALSVADVRRVLEVMTGVAISNARLVDLHDGTVRFRWKDYADHDRPKVMALSADEFLRRFLLHIVPRGFVRIRYFGLLANRRRRAQLDRCRVVLAAPPPAAPSAGSPTAIPGPSAALRRCPHCGVGVLRVITVPALRSAPVPRDTS